VRNRCLNLLRHKRLSERVHRLLPIGEDVSEELQTAEPKDEMEAMLQFIETELTPQTREVVRLRFREQKRYNEIAEQLGISEAAVYKHLAQGIRKLKARFNP
jgi:RNA polymerase sigma-70 factor (ECF subfamily)